MFERERVDQDSWKRGLYRKEAKLEEYLGPDVVAFEYQSSLHCVLEVRSYRILVLDEVLLNLLL